MDVKWGRDGEALVGWLMLHVGSADGLHFFLLAPTL